MRRQVNNFVLIIVSNDTYKLIVFWSQRPCPTNSIVCHDHSTNSSHLQIWENSWSVLIWSLLNDTEILSPKTSMGMNYLAFLGPFQKLFCYDDRDHHQDEISESCPMTILIDLVSEALSECNPHTLGAKHTHPILLQAEPQVLLLYHSLLNAKHIIKTSLSSPKPVILSHRWNAGFISMFLWHMMLNNCFYGFKKTL